MNGAAVACSAATRGRNVLLDASARIAGQHRAALELLLRYFASPPFALERIEQVSEQQVVYRLPKPQRDGRTAALSLTPLEFIDHLAALMTPPLLTTNVYGRDADVNRN